jgi:hypothetical protein
MPKDQIDIFRKSFVKHGKIGCTQKGNNINIVIRFHNHAVKVLRVAGKLDKSLRIRIKKQLISQVVNASGPFKTKKSVTEMIDALHESQKVARKVTFKNQKQIAESINDIEIV